ncbi:hypothetical protein ACEPAH_1772 [Sanghuangporus vaninii]
MLVTLAENVDDIPRFLLDGTILEGVVYGIHLTLFLECLYLLTRSSEGKIKWHLVIFTSANFILGSIHFGAQVKFSEEMFAESRGYIGGPLGSYFDNYGEVWNMLAYSAAFASNWITDALLVRECNCLILSPLAGSIVLAILLLTKIAHPINTFWDDLAVKLGSSYWASSLCINIYVTTLIIGRVWYLQSAINQGLSSYPAQPRFKVTSMFLFRDTRDNHTHADPPQIELGFDLSSTSAARSSFGKRNSRRFSSAMSILLESAALLTIISAIFEGMYASGNARAHLFLPILGQVGEVASLLIIVRVARGTAWTRDEVVELSSIRFS